MDPLLVVVGGLLLALLLVLSRRPLPGLRDAAILVEAARAPRNRGRLRRCDGESAAEMPHEEDTEDRVQV